MDSLDEEHQERLINGLWTHQKSYYRLIHRILTCVIAGMMISIVSVFRCYGSIGKRSTFALMCGLECGLLEAVRPRTFYRLSYLGLLGLALLIYGSSSHDGRVFALIGIIIIGLQNYLKYSLRRDYDEIAKLNKFKSPLKGA